MFQEKVGSHQWQSQLQWLCHTLSCNSAQWVCFWPGQRHPVESVRVKLSLEKRERSCNGTVKAPWRYLMTTVADSFPPWDSQSPAVCHGDKRLGNGPSTRSSGPAFLCDMGSRVNTYSTCSNTLKPCWLILPPPSPHLCGHSVNTQPHERE